MTFKTKIAHPEETGTQRFYLEHIHYLTFLESMFSKAEWETVCNCKGQKSNLIWIISLSAQTVHPKGDSPFLYQLDQFSEKSCCCCKFLLCSHFDWDTLCLTDDLIHPKASSRKEEVLWIFGGGWGKEGILFKQQVNLKVAVAFFNLY